MPNPYLRRDPFLSMADKGVAKIARKLGFNYAEAVTSFEFKKGRAFPVISGIVVASENEQTILEASKLNFLFR